MIEPTAAILAAAATVVTTQSLKGKNASVPVWIVGYLAELCCVSALAYFTQAFIDLGAK